MQNIVQKSFEHDAQLHAQVKTHSLLKSYISLNAYLTWLPHFNVNAMYCIYSILEAKHKGYNLQL